MCLPACAWITAAFHVLPLHSTHTLTHTSERSLFSFSLSLSHSLFTLTLPHKQSSPSRACTSTPHINHNHNTTADAETKARAAWCRDIAEVLLHTILTTSHSQRMRSTAITALNTLGGLQQVHVGVWLARALQTLQPPLMARKFVPVKVRVCCYFALLFCCYISCYFVSDSSIF